MSETSKAVMAKSLARGPKARLLGHTTTALVPASSRGQGEAFL